MVNSPNNSVSTVLGTTITKACCVFDTLFMQISSWICFDLLRVH
jgi:hypothetical protein